MLGSESFRCTVEGNENADALAKRAATNINRLISARAFPHTGTTGIIKRAAEKNSKDISHAPNIRGTS